MCGIAGILAADVQPEAAAAMVRLMHYRGPDAQGSFGEPGVALASCRLAIVDRAGSDQPLASPDGSLHLVFNGEIYNFQALREEASKRLGRAPATSGDAETIILAREVWGEDYLDHIEGMFAFALWDRKHRELRLARDRFGEKPLYWSWDGQTLAFASEAKALLAAGFGARTPSPAAIHHYLSFRAVPAPYSLFEGIRQLPPATELIFRPGDGPPRLRRYYELHWRPGEIRSPQDWAEGLRDELRRAVRSRLVSDVPLGALLSGGLDSTAVCALMAEIGRPRTFFIGFDRGERTRIDRHHARLAADQLGTDHQELEMTSSGLLSDLPRILWHLESPSVDGYQYFFAYRLARQQVTVVLSGQGGDELFAGYGWFHQIQRLDQWRRRMARLGPAVVKRLAARMTRSALSGLGKSRGADQIACILDGQGLLDAYGPVKNLLGHRDKVALYRPEFAERLAQERTSESIIGEKLTQCRDWPVTESISRLQMETDLCDILLRDTDAVSMANSLEVRLPLLDHHLVEYVLSIPSEMKLARGEGKHILRKALAGLVPEAILQRPKLGFSFPMAAWLRGPLRPLADQAFAPDTILRRGYFDPDRLRRYYRLFYEGRGPRSPFYVWCFVMLELWHRIFIDAQADAAPQALSDLGLTA